VSIREIRAKMILCPPSSVFCFNRSRPGGFT
jgi:hypothetical protein